MKSLVTAQHGQVLLANGNVTIEIANGKQNIAPGEQLPKGSTLYIEDGAEVEIAFEDGTTYSNLSSASQDSEETMADSDFSALDEIQALQDLIASGEDPTAGLPDTAAGAGTAGNQGGTDFVSVARSGGETIASSGFSTDGVTQSEFTAASNLNESVVDNPSELINDITTIDEDGVATGNVLGNDSDVDNDLTVTSFEVDGNTYTAGTEVTLEGGTLVISEDGSYTFTPNENWNGSVPVIAYTTNTGSTATLTIVVNAVDDPSIVVNDSNTIDEGSVATGNVLDNDSDIDSDLTVASFEVNGEGYTAGTTVELEGGSLVINEDGSYVFTPNDNWNGTVPVITYTTNTGSTATLTLEVTPVDDPSVLANDSNTIDEDSVATGNVLDNDSDIDSDLTVASFEVNGESYTAGTTVELEGGSLVINEDGSYIFTPNDNWNGSVPVITYTTSTGSSATLTLEVTPVDDPSGLANDSNTFDEDSVATGNVLDNDSDIDSDIDSDLTVASFEVNGTSYTAGTTVELEGGSLVINEDGSYTFTPNDNWNGTVPVITYTTNTGSTATLTLEVTPVDDPSVLANDSNTIDEDSVATGNVLDNDSDIDSDLTVASFEVNGESYTAGTTVELEGGSLVINEDGSYTFTPNDNWNGSVPVITYTTSTGSSATLTLEVTPVDGPSVLANDSNTIDEDSVATGNVLDNDSDIDSDLTVASFEVNGESYTAGTTVELEGGSLVINEDGSYVFTPNDNWNGSVPVITYTTSTGSSATLTLEVTPVDDPSVLANDSNTIDEDSVATGNVLDNDSDIDSDLTVASFEVNGESYTAGSTVELEGGSLVINEDGSYVFTPNDNWNGTVPVITYTTNTGSTATLTLEVTPVDDPATIAINDTDKGTVTEDGAVDENETTVQVTGGKLDVTDADTGEAVFQTQTEVADGDFGFFSIDESGNWTYTLNNDHDAVQSLPEGETEIRTITVTSADGTATHTVTITIVGANDPADITVGQGDSDLGTVTEDGLDDGNALTVES
ncbi:retention module-containing protein, partial [Shewanella canadensis]